MKKFILLFLILGGLFFHYKEYLSGFDIAEIVNLIPKEIIPNESKKMIHKKQKKSSKSIVESEIRIDDFEYCVPFLETEEVSIIDNPDKSSKYAINFQLLDPVDILAVREVILLEQGNFIDIFGKSDLYDPDASVQIILHSDGTQALYVYESNQVDTAFEVGQTINAGQAIGEAISFLYLELYYRDEQRKYPIPLVFHSGENVRGRAIAGEKISPSTKCMI